MSGTATKRHPQRLARDLHPVAWWCWALGAAAAASLTTNPLLLLGLIAAAALVVAARRGDQPWARSFRLYLWLGAFIIAIRVVFRILFGGPTIGPVLVDLPSIPLPSWVAGISLLGPVTADELLAAAYDGLRLATIVICVGAANSLANPKRLLKSVPPALYEIGTTLVVAVTVLPQLAESVVRVRAAQSLRAGESGRTRGLRRTLVPVLEDALERSLTLAAGMDVRGYGRAGAASPGQRRRTGALMLSGLLGVCVGVYATLDVTAPRFLALPMLVLGVLVSVGGLVQSGRNVTRTRYRPDPWGWPEFAVAAAGLAVAVSFRIEGVTHPAIVYPALDAAPSVAALGLLALIVAALPAVLAPPTTRRATGIPAPAPAADVSDRPASPSAEAPRERSSTEVAS